MNILEKLLPERGKHLTAPTIYSAIAQALGYALLLFCAYKKNSTANLLIALLPITGSTFSYFWSSLQLKKAEGGMRLFSHPQNVIYQYAYFGAAFMIFITASMGISAKNILVALVLAVSQYVNMRSISNGHFITASKNQTLYSAVLFFAVATDIWEALILYLIATSIKFTPWNRLKVATATSEYAHYKKAFYSLVETLSKGVILAPLILYPGIEALFATYYFSQSQVTEYLVVSRTMLGLTNLALSGIQFSTFATVTAGSSRKLTIKTKNSILSALLVGIVVSVIVLRSADSVSYLFPAFLYAALLQNIFAYISRSGRVDPDFKKALMLTGIYAAIYASAFFYFKEIAGTYALVLAHLISISLYFAMCLCLNER